MSTVMVGIDGRMDGVVAVAATCSIRPAGSVASSASVDDMRVRVASSRRALMTPSNDIAQQFCLIKKPSLIAARREIGGVDVRIVTSIVAIWTVVVVVVML